MDNQSFHHHTTGIGTHWEISYLGSDDFSIQINQIIQSFEQRMSRFRSDSLVSKLNHDRNLITDDTDLREMVRLGIYYQEISSGYFSLLIGSALENLGYDADYSFETKEAQMVEPSEIVVDGNTISLTGEQHLDLGGIGKGYLIHLIKQYLINQGVSAYLINGGGDIAISQNNHEFGPIALQHPYHHDQIIGQINLTHGASANSGTYLRQWGTNHHLIDPHTQQPSTNPLISIHVIHPDIIVADVTATMLFVTPIEQIETLAETLGVEYMLIFDDMSSVRSRGFLLM